MPVILKNGPNGRRAHPISAEDAAMMVSDGTAVMRTSSIYEECEPVIAKVADYERKDMVAEKKRGRPAKVETSDEE
jgi:hypothetical protein